MRRRLARRAVNPARLLRSFGHAGAGLRDLLASQPNARIHLAATVFVVLLGLFLGLARWEWVALSLTIALVWFTEAMNTAFEALCDVVRPEYHSGVKRCKDIAAAAVLLTSIAAVAVGLLVFGPRLWTLFSPWH